MNSIITKVLKQIHPHTRITEQAKETITELIGNVLTAIIKTSPSLSLDDLKKTVKEVIPGELAKHALNEADSAIKKYESSEGPHGIKNVTKIMTIHLSPVTVKKMIKSMGMDVTDIPVESFIFLAAALEYLMAEILELSGNAASDNRAKTIEKRHIEIIINYDTELIELFNKVGNPLAAHWRTPQQYPKMSKSQMVKDLQKLGIKLDGPPYPRRTKIFQMYPDRADYVKKECKGQNKDPEIYICNPRTGKYIKKNSYAAKFI